VGISVEEDGLTYSAIKYRRRKSDDQTSLIIEVTNDLQTWTTHTAPYSVEDHGDGTETVTIRSTTPFSEAQRQFFRIKASLE
jgi:hypothetical protein